MRINSILSDSDYAEILRSRSLCYLLRHSLEFPLRSVILFCYFKDAYRFAVLGWLFLSSFEIGEEHELELGARYFHQDNSSDVAGEFAKIALQRLPEFRCEAYPTFSFGRIPPMPRTQRYYREGMLKREKMLMGGSGFNVGNFTSIKLLNRMPVADSKHAGSVEIIEDIFVDFGGMYGFDRKVSGFGGEVEASAIDTLKQDVRAACASLEILTDIVYPRLTNFQINAKTFPTGVMTRDDWGDDDRQYPAFNSNGLGERQSKLKSLVLDLKPELNSKPDFDDAHYMPKERCKFVFGADEYEIEGIES